jgi:hypothetical protein
MAYAVHAALSFAGTTDHQQQDEVMGIGGAIKREPACVTGFYKSILFVSSVLLMGLSSPPQSPITSSPTRDGQTFYTHGATYKACASTIMQSRPARGSDGPIWTLKAMRPRGVVLTLFRQFSRTTTPTFFLAPHFFILSGGFS